MASIKEVYPALEKLGFQTKGNLCIGVWEGYTLTFVYTPWQRYEPWHSLYIYARLPASDTQTPRRINRERFKRGHFGRYPCRNTWHGLCFANLWFHADAQVSYEEQFLQMMEQLLPTLRQYGVEPDGRCAVCKEDDPEALGNVWGLHDYQPVHRECMERSLALGMEDLKKKYERRQRHAVLFPELAALQAKRAMKEYEKYAKKKMDGLIRNPGYKADAAAGSIE